MMRIRRDRPRLLQRGADLKRAGAGLMQKLLADLRQVDASTMATEQLSADVILNLPYAPAYGRLLDAKLPCRAPKATAFSGGCNIL
jgi:hypothetical protein